MWYRMVMERYVSIPIVYRRLALTHRLATLTIHPQSTAKCGIGQAGYPTRAITTVY